MCNFAPANVEFLCFSQNTRRRHYVFWYAVLLSGRPLTLLSRDAMSLCTEWTDFNETYHKYSTCEWEFLKRF